MAEYRCENKWRIDSLLYIILNYILLHTEIAMSVNNQTYILSALNIKNVLLSTEEYERQIFCFTINSCLLLNISSSCFVDFSMSVLRVSG